MAIPPLFSQFLSSLAFIPYQHGTERSKGHPENRSRNINIEKGLRIDGEQRVSNGREQQQSYPYEIQQHLSTSRIRNPSNHTIQIYCTVHPSFTGTMADKHASMVRSKGSMTRKGLYSRSRSRRSRRTPVSKV